MDRNNYLFAGSVDAAHHLVGRVKGVLTDGVGGILVFVVDLRDQIAADVVGVCGIGLPTIVGLFGQLIYLDSAS